MNASQLIAQAVARWLTAESSLETDLIREALPPMDVDWLFTALNQVGVFNPGKYSLAMAGFGLSEVDLQSRHQSSGLSSFRGLTDDLHVAAGWRNDRTNHPNIIALARGWHPGVNTLKHFGIAASRDLAKYLLQWAAEKNELAVNERQRELLTALQDDSLQHLVSLDSVSAFLAAWIEAKAMHPLEAPRKALNSLGLLSDPSLLEKAGGVLERLQRNAASVQHLKDASTTTLRTTRRSLNKRFKNDVETRERLLDICDRLATIRLSPSPANLASVSLEDAIVISRPPKDTEPQISDQVDDTESELETEQTQTMGGLASRCSFSDLAAATGADLLDDKQEQLTERIDGLEEALQAALNDDEKQVDAEIEVGGNPIRIEFALDPELLGWLHSYCSETSWGGVIHTKEPVLMSALKQHETVPHWNVNVNCITSLDSRELSLSQILGDWDKHLSLKGHQTQLSSDWEQFAADRSVLLENLDTLFHFPLDLMAGRSAVAQVVDRYLATATRLYHQVQQNFRNMSEVDQGWAETGLHGILSLDVMQVRCDLEDGRHSWKAVLLPTHPLHLWRYQRLNSVLRGLGSTLEPEDRMAVLDECRRPEQFLSVLFASGLPENRGASRLLPISSDLNGLATFENLQNACSGLDGAQTVHYVLDRFCVVNRKHLSPLRVGLVNPPDAPRLMAELSKLLAQRRPQSLPAMRLELFSTSAPAVKNRAARALDFSGTEQDMLESRLTSGRLLLRVHEQPRHLEQWLEHWVKEPLHVLVIFDEAGVSIRRSDMGLPMPMSPFCVRKIIRFQELRGTLKLDPTTDEPPFSEFMLLMNEADKGQRDSTPNAWADAENLRDMADRILQGDDPGALWLALADRALPSESGLHSVRLLARREGQREVLLLGRDYHRLGQLVRGAFSQWNVHVTGPQLEKLLEEGVHLAGAGILDLVKKDGTIETNRVLGLAGTLLAGRDYLGRYPGALIVSADHQIARHWLRLGKRGERCDLLALRSEGDSFILECIEVKSTHESLAGIPSSKIEEAKMQLLATLDAVADGLKGVEPNAGPLAVPRCEMLKEVLVRGCLSKSVPLEQRGRWSRWLKRIFRQEGEPTTIIVKGEIIRVALGETRATTDSVLINEPFVVSIRNLGETAVGNLFKLDDDDQGSGAEVQIKSPPIAPSSTGSSAPVLGVSLPSPVQGSQIVSGEQAEHHSNSISPPLLQNPSSSTWPPIVNELGMIGQDGVVQEVINRIHFAHDFKQPFKDTMFVGPAGVGKSSFARSIAQQLLGEQPILFNGADLRQAKMLAEKLDQEGKLLESTSSVVKVAPCLIFIDEVHAIPSTVANVLLSALDDHRTTTINNQDYDFHGVVFLMATTDAGKLTEAFRSRPDRVLLRSYTLEELAGILWLHGKKELEGYSLPREVCLEIAARTRAQPRVAVRMLTNQLVPHFYALIRNAGAAPSRSLIGEAMTHQAVAAYFEHQGIDLNGLDSTAKNFLQYLSQHGATAEERLRQGLGISNRGDFTEVDEYLQRLGLVTVRGGRSLTSEGRRYLISATSFHHRISRQQ